MNLSDQTVDALIIGAGPAGTQCAMVLDNQHIKTAIVNNAPNAGGLQCYNPYQSDWIATSYRQTGSTLAAIMEHNLQRPNLLYYGNTYIDALIENTSDTKSRFTVLAKTKDTKFYIHAHYIILATGVTPRMGNLTHHSGFIFGPGKNITETHFTDKKVAILGGGDNAFENFTYIQSQKARHIDLYAKKIIARPDLCIGVPENNIHIGDIRVNQEMVSVNDEKYDLICVFYGWQAKYFDKLAIKQKLTKDNKGYLVINEFCQTSHDNIFAIGEITHSPYPSIVQSMAQGMIAGKKIASNLSHSA
ncbi:MAG: thioredoxin reductase [Dasania sp.]|jgi:thioredoxin reductase